VVLDQRFLIYLVGGALSAAIDVGIFQALLVYGASLVVATSTGFFISLVVNYLFHARFTFTSTARTASFGKYLVVVAFNYAMALGMVSLAASLLGSPLTGKILSLPVIAIIGFFAGKHWIFK
jgi:putative flippase GtrA